MKTPLSGIVYSSTKHCCKETDIHHVITYARQIHVFVELRYLYIIVKSR